MFEKTPPAIPPVDAPDEHARFALRDGEGSLVGDALEAGAQGSSLRAIDWSELIARLDAARDLRRILQTDTNASGNEFADAAARFLNDRDEQETDINLVTLEHSKGSPDMIHEPNTTPCPNTRNQGHAATAGDARED